MDVARRNAPCALVVDDNPLIRTNAAEILEENGFATMEAASAAEALQILELPHRAIVLLFTDVQMPGSRDGFALARETAHRWPHVSIAVASGHLAPSPDDLPDKAHFVAKPFSARVVRQHLQAGMPEEQQPEALRN